MGIIPNIFKLFLLEEDWKDPSPKAVDLLARSHGRSRAVNSRLVAVTPDVRPYLLRRADSEAADVCIDRFRIGGAHRHTHSPAANAADPPCVSMTMTICHAYGP